MARSNSPCSLSKSRRCVGGSVHDRAGVGGDAVGRRRQRPPLCRVFRRLLDGIGISACHRADGHGDLFRRQELYSSPYPSPPCKRNPLESEGTTALTTSQLQRWVHSSSPACCCSKRRSRISTLRSSSVEVSPVLSTPAAMSRNRRRMILPLRALGRASVKWISPGRASAPISLATW